MRTLYYVPIKHVAQEYYSPRKYLKEQKEIYGEVITRRREREKYYHWLTIIRKIKEEIKKGNLDCTKLFIYQDSVPIKIILTDKLKEKIRERTGGQKETLLSKEEVKKFIGDPGFKLIYKLIEKGAITVGTESQDLLDKDEEIGEELKRLNTAKEKAVGKAYFEIEDRIKKTKAEWEKILQQRDEFIAKRIDATLPQDKIGILFIGMSHRVDKELKKVPDIKVIYLLGGN